MWLIGPTWLSRHTWAYVVVALLVVGSVVTGGGGSAIAAGTNPVISDYSANPASLPYTGGSVMLSADVFNASLCTFSTTDRAVTGLPATVSCSAGTASTIVTVAANFAMVSKKVKIVLTALGSDSDASAEATVTVGPAPPKPKVSSFLSSPDPVPFTGGTATLSATVDNASSCTFSSNSILVSGLPTTVPCSSGTVSAIAGVTLNATTRTVTIPIKITVAGPVTSTRSKTTITLAPAPPPAITSYSASPSPVSWTGGPATLSGAVINATKCTFSAIGKATRVVSGLPVTVPCASGSATANVFVAGNRARRTKTYTVELTATGSGAKVTTATDITISAVTTPPSVSDFASNPTPVPSTGGSATLSATVSDAVDCTFTAKSPAVSGLPLTVPCSVGTVSANVTVPANTRGQNLKYRITLLVHGQRKKVKATTFIIVSRAHGSG